MAVHTPFLTDLNEATLDGVPLARRLEVEKEGSDGGGRGGGVAEQMLKTWVRGRELNS